MPVKPYIPSNPCGITLVGEAPGEEEEQTGLVFVGAAGRELTALLSAAGIDRYTCHITNVFDTRPPNNDLSAWCVGAVEARKLNGGTYPWNPLSRGKYLIPSRLSSALERLKQELTSFAPRLVIALGNTPLYALTGSGGISTVRGVVQPCSLIPGLKVFPTYHPAYILRQYGDRPVVIADLMKAKRELSHKEIIRPEREIYIEPTISDLYEWDRDLSPAKMLACDIETKRGQITCIGFAPDRSRAYVVPFVDRRKANYSYWLTLQDELLAMTFVRSWLQSPAVKIFQNGMYDIQWIWRKWGIPVKNFREDTMLRHHAIQPEMQKGLGFLGSLYTNEAAWKLMRAEAADTIKRDE